MISGSVVVPFQKGPCGEGGRMRGFLLPLLLLPVVVVLVLLLIFFVEFPSSHNTKINSNKIVEKFCGFVDGPQVKRRGASNEKLLGKNRDNIFCLYFY